MRVAERRRQRIQFDIRSIDVLEVSDQFAALSRHGRIVTANTAARRLLGLDGTTELVGCHMPDFIAPDYRRIIQDMLELNVIDMTSFPLMILLPDGRTQQAEIKVHPARELGDGCTIVTLRDLAAETRLAIKARRMDKMFRLLVDSAMHMICRCRNDRVVYINQAGRQLVQEQSNAGQVDWPVWDFFDEPYRSLFAEDMSLLLDETDRIPVRFRRRDGVVLDAQIRITLLSTTGDDVEYMLEARDITRQNKAVAALRAINDGLEHRVAERTDELNLQKNFVESLLTAMPNPIWWKDLEGRLLGANASFSQLMSAIVPDWQGKRFEEIAPLVHLAMFKTPSGQDQLPAKRVFEMEMEINWGNGPSHYLVNETAWLDEASKPAGTLCVMSDISRLKSLEVELRRLATTDTLSGASNRRYFMEQTEHFFKVARLYNRPMGFLMLDIDHFKRVNDTFGHPVGDEAIKALSAVCRDHLRTNDVFGRLGGEEFGICLPNTDVEGCTILAERLRQAVSEIVLQTGDAEVRFTASIGVACSSKTDPDIKSQMARADSALYRAKNGGRNQVVVD